MPGEGIGSLVPNHPSTSAGFVVSEGRAVIVDDYRTERRFAVPQSHLDAGLRSALIVPVLDRGRIIGVLAVRTRAKRSFGCDEVRFVGSLANLLSSSLQRAQSEEALSHAQRLESVGQLTGGIAHDFNNLLTVIQGNLQVLEELPALAGEAYGQQLVSAAARASARGAELTSKLLAFSRRQVLQPCPVNIRALVVSLADMLRRTLDQRIRIQVEVQSDLQAMADPGQLESALLNIAINARDAMPEGGVLRFAAMPCDALPDDVLNEVDAQGPSPGDFVAISISDEGSGMTEETKERAFEPFFTTKLSGRGTGLGLSTVYGFVKQSKGAVSIASTLGKGTTLTLYIPRPQHEEPRIQTGEASEVISPGLRVLLVEDDSEVAAVVQAHLAALGCETTFVPSGEQALLFLDRSASFDLLLTDIALGSGVRGTEVAAQLQERVPSVAVLLMSGYSAELLEADQTTPAHWELLRKPFSRPELARAINRVRTGTPSAPG